MGGVGHACPFQHELCSYQPTSFPEYTWSRRTEQDRKTELGLRVKQNIISVVISFIWYVSLTLTTALANSVGLRIWLPSATALLCFLCYTLIAKQQLTLDKAFTSIMLFAQLQGPMLQFPSQIFALINGMNSVFQVLTRPSSCP